LFAVFARKVAMTPPSPSPHEVVDLGNLTLDELRSFVARHRERPTRVVQLFRGVNLHGARTLAEIPELSRRVVDRLEPFVRLRQLQRVGEVRAADGAAKLLFRTARGDAVEAVLFPMTRDHTLCLSSQAGCRVRCAFCLTGALDLSARSLTAGEILDQYREAVREVDDPRGVTNVVFMGMGEPLLNYANVVRAIRVLTAEQGRQLSTRRITVSTSGVAPLIPRLVEETGVRLAVSLITADDRLRDELVPVNRRWPLKVLRASRDQWQRLASRRLTIEVVLLDGVNDSDAHAAGVGAWLQGLDAKVNLIPFNGYPGALFRSPSPERVQAFAGVLRAAGFPVQLRERRGDEVQGACGQLGGGFVARQVADGA
jgi:23S rRNA (adenine2503-C2)-methyltransferase